MAFLRHDPSAVGTPVGGYTHGLEVPTGARLLFISGQIPTRKDGSVPPDFEDQCRAVWGNIVAVLTSANMTVDNLVKVTTYLGSRDHADANAAVRREILGKARPALTVIVAEIFDAAWLLEIEAIAAG